MHQALVGLAQMRGVLTDPDFISNDTAAIAGLRQKPGMVKAWGGTGRVAIPTDSRVGSKLVDLAFDRQSERGPAEYAALAKHGAVRYLDSLRVRIPLRPLGRIDDVLPNTFARCMDDEFIVCEQISLRRIESGRPVNIARAVREIVFHGHGGLPFSLSVGLRDLAAGRSKYEQRCGSGDDRQREPQIGDKCRFHFQVRKMFLQSNTT